MNKLLKIKEKKLNKKYQQNLIEMLGYIYLEFPQKHTYETLGNEMNKNKRTIKRMIDDINAVCPCIKIKIDNISKKASFFITDNMSESIFDKNFPDYKYAPLLYFFLKSFLIRKISYKEITENMVLTNEKDLKAKRKKAGRIILDIFDSTPVIDYTDENGELVIGNPKFLNFEYNQKLFYKND